MAYMKATPGGGGGFPFPGVAYFCYYTYSGQRSAFENKSLPTFQFSCPQESAYYGLINVEGYSAFSITGTTTVASLVEYAEDGTIIDTHEAMTSLSVTFNANTKYIMFSGNMYYGPSAAFTATVTLS